MCFCGSELENCLNSRNLKFLIDNRIGDKPYKITRLFDEPRLIASGIGGHIGRCGTVNSVMMFLFRGHKVADITLLSFRSRHSINNGHFLYSYRFAFSHTFREEFSKFLKPFNLLSFFFWSQLNRAN